MLTNINRRQRRTGAPTAEASSQPATAQSFSFSFELQNSESSDTTHNPVASALAAASTPIGPFHVPPQPHRRKSSIASTSKSKDPFAVVPVAVLPPSSLYICPQQFPGNFLDFAGPGTHCFFAPRFPPAPSTNVKAKGKGKAGKVKGKGRLVVPTSPAPELVVSGVPVHQVQDPVDCSWSIGLQPFLPEDFGFPAGALDAEGEGFDLPDFSIDPDSHLLSIINTTTKPKAVFLTVTSPYHLFDGNYRALGSAVSVFPACGATPQGGGDGAGALHSSPAPACSTVTVSAAVTTLSVVLPPLAVLDAALLYRVAAPLDAPPQRACRSAALDPTRVLGDEPLDLAALQAHLHSNVTPLALPPLKYPLPPEQPPVRPRALSTPATRLASSSDPTAAPQLVLAEAADLWHPLVPALRFPLLGGPYLCTQGPGGCLTHYSPQTRHAVDLACPRGTPVLAVADAEVVSVRASSVCEGCHTANLFEWNSVMLRIKPDALAFVQRDGTGADVAGTAIPPRALYVEYVHLAPHSIRVQPGDLVRAGAVLGCTGAAGFCPQPHLHVQVQASARADAPTVPFAFARSHIYGLSAAADMSAANAASGAGVCTDAYVPQAGAFLCADGLVSKGRAAAWLRASNAIADVAACLGQREYEPDEVYSEATRLPYCLASLITEYVGDLDF